MFWSVVSYELYPWKREFDLHLHIHPDKEDSVILTPKGQADIQEGDHVWVLLPGGMSSGENFYTDEAIGSGLFDGSKIAIFHNPGIINQMKNRVTPALAETTYLLEYVRFLKSRDITVSLVGWSAGSILAIKIAGERPNLCVAVVGIHGPSIIDDVFNIHANSYLRIDIAFSFWLYHVLWRSNSLKNVPVSCGFPMLQGWDWMKSWTTVVHRHKTASEKSWNSITHTWLSWEDLEVFPSNVLRIVSKNDPIVVYSDEIRSKIHAQKEMFEHWLYEDGAHCSPFRWCRGLTARLVRWHLRQQEEYKERQKSAATNTWEESVGTFSHSI